METKIRTEIESHSHQEIQALVDETKQDPRFPKYLEMLREDIGEKDYDWGGVEPLEDLIYFLVWDEMSKQQQSKAAAPAKSAAVPKKLLAVKTKPSSSPSSHNQNQLTKAEQCPAKSAQAAKAPEVGRQVRTTANEVSVEGQSEARSEFSVCFLL